MPERLVLRRATEDDAGAAADVWLRSFATALPSVRLAHTEQEVRDWVRHVLVPRHETWVALVDERVVGLLTLGDGELEQLYLDPPWQGGGIGGRLVDLAKRRRPAGLTLWTFQVNESAHRFYERHGFRAVERTDGARNEEREPDVRYVWSPSGAGRSLVVRRPSSSIPSIASMITQDGPAEQRDVGDVADEPAVVVDEVDHVPAREAGRAEQPVQQVGERATQQQTERDRPVRGAHPAGQPADADHGPRGDHREDPGRAGADGERGAGVVHQPQLQELAQHRDGRPVGEVVLGEQLGELVGGERHHRDDGQQHEPAGPGPRDGLVRRVLGVHHR